MAARILGALSLLALVAWLTAPREARAGDPFPWEDTAVEVGSSSLSGPTWRSIDDVVVNPFDDNEVFATQTGNTSQQHIMKFSLIRTGGEITGGTKDFSSLSTLQHNSQGLKALDVFDSDTAFYSMEEGEFQGTGTNDGSVGRLTDLTSSLTHTDAAGLRSVRNDGGTDYDPEGLAIDRANDYLYVMTDDATDQDVTQYSINSATLALTLNWTTTIEAGTSNGNDGIVLSDGRIASVAGSSTVSIYAISQDGNTVTDLLGGSVTRSGDTPQDLLLQDGFLYLLWESGMVDAFDASDLGNMTNTVVDSLDLDSTLPGGGDAAWGGMDMTADGHLLLSTRGGPNDEDGRVFALNKAVPPAVPALSAAGLLVFAASLLGFIGYYRRRL